ncbi:carboxypeptidase-like regulatory domain-containing protein [Psychroserpens damuponensis]|uniref:carboxypeptidase-like regulatory domain-containing protein n=1 Tax=Psychroserpens damuponensis TaxID=943936 RepID=UPI0005905098|nr:carboxypeptidase-like regulatory domain-containing protein [Psychroserpens damuponensis]
MRTTLNINIPTPCHEDWSKMTLQQQGRHCSSCEKTVYDFTSKTDEHIIKTYQAQNNLCGRFKTTQLDRELVLSRKEKNNYLSYVASTFFAFLSFGSIDAQAQEPPKIEAVNATHNPTIKGKIAVSVLHKIISGTVTDSQNDLPMHGVTIVIKGTKKGTQTDVNGHYKLAVKKGDILVFSYLGYDKKEVKVSHSNLYNIAFESSDISIMGEVILHDPKIEDTHSKNESKKRSTTGQLLYDMSNIFRRKQ